ncbi:transposase [Telluribacter sp. SYSU D00476]|uniref:transposase n=1 Tax=Telluribacter sp. SYSU D00476 TaxID=2811430 RepID=UPI001FF66131|nr:transposase [Telluribacter sp. SYSU D00476]
MSRRKVSVEEKLAILKEAEATGITQTIRRHGIYAKMIYCWREQLETGGREGLKSYQRVDPELRRLQLENLASKKLIAEKDRTAEAASSCREGGIVKKTQSRNKAG